MKKTSRIFIACALSAMAGIAIAFELHSKLWWLGALVAGTLAYIGYDLREIRRAVPRAWKRAITWRPDCGYWSFVTKCTVYFLCTLSTVLTALFLPILLISIYRGESDLAPAHWIAVTIFFSFFATILSIAIAHSSYTRNPQKNADELKDFRLIARVNAISIIWILPILVGRMLIATAPAFWSLIKQIIHDLLLVVFGLGEFFTYLFIEVHSSERILCCVDAMIGFAVGYFAGSMIIGAIAGGLLGILNYEVVSKRILKVVPMTSTS